MATYGLTNSGFTPEPQTAVRSDLDTSVQAARGASVDVSDGSPTGFFNGILSESLTNLWDGLQAIYSSFDPDKATGQALDALCALTATFRVQAASTVIAAILVGITGTAIPQNSQAVTGSTNAVFYTNAACTLATAPVWVVSTAYTIGTTVTNGVNVYTCIAAGTSASVPTGTGPTFTDGALVWGFMGVGTAYASQNMLSLTRDAIVCNQFDLKTITTPVSGWNYVNNYAAGALGNLAQTDESLRVTREAQLTSEASTTFSGMIAGLSQLGTSVVTSVTLFDNPTATVSSGADLTPAYSFQPLIVGPVSAANNTLIAQQIYNSKSLGIQCYGVTDTGTAVDSQGNSHTIAFTRPTNVTVYVRIDLLYDPTAGAYAGDAAVRTAIYNYILSLPPGRNVMATAISSAVISGGLGVIDVPRNGIVAGQGGCLIGINSLASTTTDITVSISIVQNANQPANSSAFVTVFSAPGTL